MYQTHKTFVTPKTSMWDLINENSRLLLLLEHFEIDFTVGEKSVEQLCNENSISVNLFVTLANLYNGFYPDKKTVFNLEDISDIIRFLTNSHNYYKQDKYPEITGYIRSLLQKTEDKRVRLIEDFFKKYFDEVVEHLDYEDKIAFPYFKSLADNFSQKAKKENSSRNLQSISSSRKIDLESSSFKTGAETTSLTTDPGDSDFSAKEYSLHHTDIETKLADLKSLLIKHIHLNNELTLRRKLLFSLQELEYDLLIHALIEDAILLPLANKIEKEWKSSR